jgi:hypothetical protein
MNSAPKPSPTTATLILFGFMMFSRGDSVNLLLQETLRISAMRDHESLRFPFEFFYRRFKARQGQRRSPDSTQLLPEMTCSDGSDGLTHSAPRGGLSVQVWVPPLTGLSLMVSFPHPDDCGSFLDQGMV